MAAAKEDLDSRHVIQCGNCMEVDGYLWNPVVLPCGHEFCEKCLQDHHPKMKTITCFICKEKTDVKIEDMPSAIADLKTFCEACIKQGKMKMTAKCFCIQCKKKFCAKHVEWHNEGIDDHNFLAIRDYLDSSLAEEQRCCQTHKAEVLNIGCKQRWMIFCPDCLSTAGTCDNGNGHQYTSLKQIATQVKQSTEPLTQKAEDRFDDIAALIKEVTILLSEWDIGTEEGVRLLHRTRDEQIKGIYSNYEKLEQEYLKSRIQSKETITEYLAKEGGGKLIEFLRQLKRLRAMVSYKHPVDLVQERIAVQEEVQKFISEKFPPLLLENQASLVPKDKTYRETELDLCSAPDLTLSITSSSADCVGPAPTKMTLIKRSKMDHFCSSVCHHNDETYVAVMHHGIMKINKLGGVSSAFDDLNDINGIKFHKGRLYCSGYRNVLVYGIKNEQQLSSWSVSDHGHTWPGCRMSFIGEDLAVADREYQRITLYTTNGEEIRHVACNSITPRGKVVICRAEQQSIIISNEPSSTVCKLNLESGEIEWKSSCISGPQAVTCDLAGYVLVAIKSKVPTLWVLDTKTGELVGTLIDNTMDSPMCESSVYDICVDGSTLIMPRFDGKEVLYYELH